MTTIEINRDLAQRVLDVVDAGLRVGLGEPIPGKMCVEAAVCYAMGLPHGDEPICVSPALCRLKVILNDTRWSSPAARAAGLRRLAIAQLGSASALDDGDFARRCAELAIATYVPKALRIAANMSPYDHHKKALRNAADRCEAERSKAATDAALAAAFAAAAYATNSTHAAAGAARAAADAADATTYATHAAAYAARAATHVAASAYGKGWAASDKILSDFAEDVVQILIELGAPGCAYLDLAPRDARAAS